MKPRPRLVHASVARGIMANISEYERGYKDGTKDCQALYGRILARICVALDEKDEREQVKEARKIFAG